MRGEWPDWGPLLALAVASAVLCAVSLRLFKKRSGEMVDEL
jgi:lipopolysaccharide transport system permease protein